VRDGGVVAISLLVISRAFAATVAAISHNVRQSSPEIANVQTAGIALASSGKDVHCGNGMLGVNGVPVSTGNGDIQEHGKVDVDRSERCPIREILQNINQNLRHVDSGKDPIIVGPETKSRRQNGTGNSRHRPESPAGTGRQQKSKSRRSRNRSLAASRDDRPTNEDDAEPRRNQNGGRKWTRSRTLSPALTERFDYHVSRPVQTDRPPCRPEMARRDVTAADVAVDFDYESSSECFRSGVQRAAAATSEQNEVGRTSSPAQSRRYVTSVSK